MSQEAIDLDGEPRRGGRSRRQVERYDPGTGKGKERADSESSDEEANDSDEEEARPLGTNKRAANGVRKSRTSKGAKEKSKKRSRTSAAADGQATSMPQGLKDDCPLFNALLSPDIALQPLIEDWVETYQSTANDEVSEKTSVQELVLFLIRCCGLTADVDDDEAVDADGVLDVIERIQDESVKHISADYPLISRQKALRAFRTNLDLFISHLIATLSLTPILYATPDNTSHSSLLLGLILTWLHSMSSSPLRPIRHTSTYIILKINTALCEVAVQVNKDLSLAQRQRENESKKSGVGAAFQKRLKDAEGRVKEQHERKVKLEEFMQETFDVAFVHRVRDADPTIRTDCLRELGQWVKKYPEHYVSTGYLNYFTRGCNDPNSHARLETVKALVHLFDKKNLASNARTVTLRLTPRLIEMALRDVELSVRVNALHVVSLIDSTGVLADEDEEQRAKVARLVFDHEPRVRKAVGAFFRGLWDERLEALKGQSSSLKGNKKKRLAGLSDAELETRLGYKAIAQMLVETAEALDESSGDAAASERQMVNLPVQGDGMTRATAAVEALWGEFESLQDWQGLADYLLLDHSTHESDLWLLDEGEEGLMIQILIACVRHADKDEDEEEKTNALINILPRLLSKNQSYPSRLSGILSIPEKMNLGLYLDLRMTKQYDSLWDDLTKIFLQQTDAAVLTAAIQAINMLYANEALASLNNAKLAELEESLFSSLRDAIAGEDVTMMSIDEDQRISFEAVLLRLTLLGRSRDLTEPMLDEEGGQTGGWDIVSAFAERGKTGWKEEVKIIEYAIQTIFLSLTWLFKRFTGEDASNVDKISVIKEKRDRALEIYEALGLRNNNNAVESVRRQAIISYINIYMLFSPRSDAPAAKACSLKMPDEKQHKLGGAFEAALEAYAESRREPTEDEPAEEPENKTAQDFLFLQLTSVVVGAIRCGVLDIDHAPIPLTHYGRYGTTYDAVVRRLVDVLRDEGIYNNQAQTVVNIASDALQHSFQLFLDDEDGSEDPSATVALAKLLSSAFIIHGTHFTVLRYLNPSDVADFHTTSLDYVLTKVGDLVRRERQLSDRKQKIRVARLRVRVLTYFRALLLLLGPVTPQDALKLRSHLQEGLGRTGATVTGHEQWKAYEAYEKKLVGIAGKDEGVRQASRKVAQMAPVQAGQGRKRVSGASAVAEVELDDEGEDVDEQDEQEGQDEVELHGAEDGERDGTPTPTSQPPARQKKRGRAQRDAADEDEPMQEPDYGADGPSMDVDIDAEFAAFEKEQAEAPAPAPALKRRRTVKK